MLDFPLIVNVRLFSRVLRLRQSISHFPGRPCVRASVPPLSTYEYFNFMSPLLLKRLSTPLHLAPPQPHATKVVVYPAFLISAPAQPHATKVVVYPAFSISAPAQPHATMVVVYPAFLISAPAQPHANKVVVYPAFLISAPTQPPQLRLSCIQPS